MAGSAQRVAHGMPMVVALSLAMLSEVTAAHAAQADRGARQMPPTRVVIRAIDAPGGEQKARQGVILSQPVTARAIVKLDEEMPESHGDTNFKKRVYKTKPQGTLLFVQEQVLIAKSGDAGASTRGNIYCVGSELVTNFGIIQHTPVDCFLDKDRNGTLDTYAYGSPVFSSNYDPQLVQAVALDMGPIPREIRYSPSSDPIPPSSVKAQISWAFAGKRPRHPETEGAKIKLKSNFGGDLEKEVEIQPGKATEIAINGAEISVAGFTPKNELIYTIRKAMPEHVAVVIQLY